MMIKLWNFYLLGQFKRLLEGLSQNLLLTNNYLQHILHRCMKTYRRRFLFWIVLSREILCWKTTSFNMVLSFLKNISLFIYLALYSKKLLACFLLFSPYSDQSLWPIFQIFQIWKFRKVIEFTSAGISLT